jgi:hypothetical protein
MKTILCMLLMIFLKESLQMGYYVSSLAGSSPGKGTAELTWTSLNSINCYSFCPGEVF